MTDRLGKAFRFTDRLLGGELPPSRTQRFAARYPFVVGLLSGLISFGFGMLISDRNDGAAHFLHPLLFATAMGCVFVATSFGERKRQARLERAGH